MVPTENMLQKARDGRRLCQTKLNHIEENLQRVRTQQDRLREFVAVRTEMDAESKHLYEVNKRQASLLKEQQELERFEKFEAVNGRFQRIRTLSQTIADSRAEQGKTSQQIAAARRSTEEAEKRLIVEEGKTQDAYETVTSAAQSMAEASRQAALAACNDATIATYEQLLQTLRQRLEILQKEQTEGAALTKEKQEELTAQQLSQQTLEAHKSMLLRAKAILTQLDEMQTAIEQRDSLTAQLSAATQRQNERNEQLSRLFYKNEELKAEINSQQEEIDSHRRSLAGQDSYTLQRRALELRSRKLLLQTALSLWRNIAFGYDQIEQKEQLITRLRHRSELLNVNIDDLTDELRRLQSQLDERTYQWTLSKSQNIIELRGDLQEGTPCTVCGSTHHPWHSEGIGEHSALIASLKADCETLSVDIRMKKHDLEEAQMQLTTTLGKIEVETDNLQILSSRQQNDTAEWQHFATLDHSMNECSRSTNREARADMIQQLIEKTSVDADEAEKELKAFTFHLDAISTIGLQMQQRQHEASELAIRLNEVNTACQVMVGEVDRLTQQLKAANQNYSRRYQEMEHAITLTEWFREWQASNEGLKMRIQQMADRWQTQETAINRLTDELATLAAKDALLQRDIKQTTLDITKIESLRVQADEQCSKARNSLEKIVADGDTGALFNEAQDQLAAQTANMTSARRSYLDCLRDSIHTETLGKHIEQTILATEERVADERRELDVWMRQYNANHPPVQYAELERVLSDGREWDAIRQQVREIVIEQAVTQSRVDRLRARIIALQAEGIRPSAADDESQQTQLRSQQEELEQQRRQILLQIARYDALLDTAESSTPPSDPNDDGQV